MGLNFSIELHEPQWFSYYGPVRQTDTSETLDAAITNQLQEMGISSSIPFRTEQIKEIVVPVALNDPPFLILEKNKIEISFASTLEGKITFTSNDFLEEFNFNSNLSNKIIFNIPNNSSEWNLKFDFDVNSGVSSRIYSLLFNNNLVIISEDKIVIDGITSTISKIYKNDNDNSNPNDFCLICCSEPATVVALPCRHCCMCRKCSEKFSEISTNCPLCRSNVIELIEMPL